MILEEMDFTEFFLAVDKIFSECFSEDEVEQIMEYVEILADANFRCYRANMLVIDARKNDNIPDRRDKLISDMEWVARNVGEYRVSSKARINKFIVDVRPKQSIPPESHWSDDDIVYSVGEMMDRLSIEFIKREDFFKNNRPKHMTESSQDLSNRVIRYLRYKLETIVGTNGTEGRGYECVHEQRTYDIEQILDDLVI